MIAVVLITLAFFFNLITDLELFFFIWGDIFFSGMFGSNLSFLNKSAFCTLGEMKVFSVYFFPTPTP